MQHCKLSTRQDGDTGKENMTRMAEKQRHDFIQLLTGGAEKPEMENCPHLCGPRHVIQSLLLLLCWIVHPEGARQVAGVCTAAITNNPDFN